MPLHFKKHVNNAFSMFWRNPARFKGLAFHHHCKKIILKECLSYPTRRLFNQISKHFSCSFDAVGKAGVLRLCSYNIWHRVQLFLWLTSPSPTRKVIICIPKELPSCSSETNHMYVATLYLCIEPFCHLLIEDLQICSQPGPWWFCLTDMQLRSLLIQEGLGLLRQYSVAWLSSMICD